MRLNKLLARQLKNSLSSDLLQHEQVMKLVKVVNDSYNAYEKELALSEHAFDIAEKEYEEINEQLNKEVASRRNAIKDLKKAIEQIDGASDHTCFAALNDDNLVATLKYLNEQISIRKNIEKDLKNSEQRLSAMANRFGQLIANLHNGILVEDEDRNIVLTNRLFCDMFRIPVAPEALVGMNCSQSAKQNCHLFKDPVHFISRIEELLEKRQLVMGDELELIDGRTLVRDYVPIFSGSTYKGHLWKYIDITYEKETRRELYRLSLVASANENGVVFTDTDGVIFWTNDGFARMTGHEQADIIGNTPIQLCKGPLTDKDCLQSMIKVFKAGKSFSVELLHYRKNGSWFWGKVKGQPILDECGRISHYFAVIEDITEKKHAEELLRKNEEKYRSIISNMSLGLIEVDLNGVIRFTNQTFCQMSGYPENFLVGKMAGNLFVEGEGRIVLQEKDKMRLQGISDAYEMLVRDAMGNQRWWLISGAPLYDDRGEIIGSTGIHLDITDQKKLQLELVNARREAEESSRSKEHFLANMSHEIRTPMNAVLGMAGQLAKTKLDGKQRFYLDTIHSASESLLVILNDILDLTKIKAGKVSLEKIGFRPEAVLERSLQVMNHKAEEKGLLMKKTVVTNDLAPILIGDPYRINQILLNLLSNAVKFTNEGSIELCCRVIEDHANEQKLLIQVIDTGIGMDEKFVTTLFDKFTQEYESCTRKFGGTGLGMNICKELVALMNGCIDVESKKNVGTTISIGFCFPKGSHNDLPSTNIPSANTAMLESKSILVVDDNDMNRLVATTILENYGIVIYEASNGEEALNFLKQHVVDVVLMDIQMPVMNGLEAARIIRQDISKTLPIIALTANAIKGESDKCLQAGMNDYLYKPFDESQLVKTISVWLAAI